MKKDEQLITIASIGEKLNKFWIKDEQGEFYSGFKEWEGSQNTEYLQLIGGNHNEPFKEGDRALVQFTKTVGKDDKIYKNLKGIFPTDTSQSPAPVEKPHQGQNIASQRHQETIERLKEGAKEYHERNYEQEAYVKCCSIWLAADLHHQTSSADLITAIGEGRYWIIFQAIKADGEKRFNPSKWEQNKDELKAKIEANDKPLYPEDEPPIEAYEEIPY